MIRFIQSRRLNFLPKKTIKRQKTTVKGQKKRMKRQRKTEGKTETSQTKALEIKVSNF